MKEKIALEENFEMMTEEQKELFTAIVRHYRDQYITTRETVDGASAAHGFHLKMDELTQSKKDDPIQPTCSKGCSFCCYIHNEITSDEADLLIMAAEDSKLVIDRLRLEKQQGHSLQSWKELNLEDNVAVIMNNHVEGAFAGMVIATNESGLMADMLLKRLNQQQT